jgi:hypothetical protein
VRQPDDLANPSVARATAWARRHRFVVARLCARLVLGLAATGAAVLAAPEPAAAQPKKSLPATSKSIAIRIEGPDAESFRGAILAVVPETLEVVDPDAFDKALKNAGVKLPIGKTITDARQRAPVLTKIRKAAAALKLEAVVLGLVRQTGGKKDLYLTYIDQIPGDLAVDEPIQLRGNEADHLRSIDATLGPVLREIAPPPPENKEEPASEPEKTPPKGEGEEPPEEEEPPGARPKHVVPSALFAAELGVELGGRWFFYSDAITTNLRPYEVFGAPLIAVGAELYPLAGTTLPVVQGLGLTVAYARAIGLSSATEGSEDTIPTTYQRFGVGLRLRIPVGEGAEAPVVGANAGLRLLTFSYDAPEDIEREVPEVTYTLLRFGVDGRAPVGPVAFLAGFDLLVPLSSGAVYDRFTDAGVLGIGLGGGLAVPIPVLAGLEARALVEYARFFSSFGPQLGDDYVAGGALDQFLGIRLAGAYVY